MVSRAPARRAAAGLACLLLLSVLAACDQFARVGIQDVAASGAPSLPSVDAGRVHDAGVIADAGPDPVAECPEVVIAVCNPVTNEGCSAGLDMQCGIDLTAPLTGYCVFIAPPAVGMPDECLNTGVTESCPATTACFAGKCHGICLCDADCDAGQRCSEPIEGTGFSVCSGP